jgi:hypothetical protein
MKNAEKYLTVAAQTGLEKAVKRWVNGMVEDGYPAASILEDLLRGGCQSGMVGGLIYYKDTLTFYRRHRAEINKLLSAMLAETGEKGPAGLFGGEVGWDSEDPLALDTTNQNLLAWFGFEETARALAGRAGIEV